MIADLISKLDETRAFFNGFPSLKKHNKYLISAENQVSAFKKEIDKEIQKISDINKKIKPLADSIDKLTYEIRFTKTQDDLEREKLKVEFPENFEKLIDESGLDYEIIDQIKEEITINDALELVKGDLEKKLTEIALKFSN